VAVHVYTVMLLNLLGRGRSKERETNSGSGKEVRYKALHDHCLINTLWWSYCTDYLVELTAPMNVPPVMSTGANFEILHA
jgi:hypothetical protein